MQLARQTERQCGVRRPVSPASGTQFSYYSQPITLVVANGVATGGASPITAVEVATDAAFTAGVTTHAVATGANSQPTITLDHLAPATTYYWRVKTTAGDNPGVYSSPASFSIGPLLVIQPPVPVQPLAGSFAHKRPTFTVTNAVRTGPAATLTYRFEVATDPAMSATVASKTAPEGPSQTSFTPSSDLVSGATYYWRAQATDAATAVVSGYSATQAFATVAPDDGTFPYTFVVRVPDHCEYYTSLHPVIPVDGALVVSGDRLRFSVPTFDMLPALEPLALDVARAGRQLSGTVGGTWLCGRPCEVSLSKTATLRDRAVFSGSADSDGRLSGTFDGYLWAGNNIYTWVECAASFTWTLTPRR
jgi:hypothetical protein